MADEERVAMRHPSHGADGQINDTITRTAFDEVWKPLGWVEVKNYDPSTDALDAVRVRPNETPKHAHVEKGA